MNKLLPAPQGAADEQLRHSDRLNNAAAAAGGKPGKSKSATYKAIASNLNESNVADVASALDLPETVGKAGVLQRARELKNTGGRSLVQMASVAPEAAMPEPPADGGNRLMQAMPAEPMASAAALQIPEGIPAPNPDGTPPQSAPQGAPNGDFESQLAELSAMLQQIGQAQAPGPVANARDSMVVAAPLPPRPQRTWQDSQNRLLAQ